VVAGESTFAGQEYGQVEVAGSFFGAQGVPVKSPEVAPEVLEGRLGVELFDLGERDRAVVPVVRAWSGRGAG
jgi:hypothetical protein